MAKPDASLVCLIVLAKVPTLGTFGSTSHYETGPNSTLLEDTFLVTLADLDRIPPPEAPTGRPIGRQKSTLSATSPNGPGGNRQRDSLSISHYKVKGSHDEPRHDSSPVVPHRR